MVAHIAGIPVEETVLSMAPVVLVTLGAAGVYLRNRLDRGHRRRVGAGQEPVGVDRSTGAIR